VSATQRIRQGAAAVVTATLTDAAGGVPSPLPDSATVTITRSDGTPLATDAAATGVGDATFTFPLAASQTVLLDRLTCVWTTAALGAMTTTVEIVGGFVFEIAELQAMDQNLAAKSAAEIAALRTTVEDALERELGYALVPRYTRATVRTTSTLRLKPYLRAIRSVSSGGVDLTPEQVAALQLTQSGAVSGFAWQYPTVVAYEHGLDEPPMHAREHALRLAKLWGLKGPIDDRTTALVSDVGITSTLAIPGRGGSIFGLPAVDQWITSNRVVLGA